VSSNIIDAHTHPYAYACIYTHIYIYTYVHNLQRVCPQMCTLVYPRSSTPLNTSPSLFLFFFLSLSFLVSRVCSAWTKDRDSYDTVCDIHDDAENNTVTVRPRAGVEKIPSRAGGAGRTHCKRHRGPSGDEQARSRQQTRTSFWTCIVSWHA